MENAQNYIKLLKNVNKQIRKYYSEHDKCLKNGIELCIEIKEIKNSFYGLTRLINLVIINTYSFKQY